MNGWQNLQRLTGTAASRIEKERKNRHKLVGNITTGRLRCRLIYARSLGSFKSFVKAIRIFFFIRNGLFTILLQLSPV